MFGYVRPLKDELKVREFEQFKALYCALCHALKNNYGTFTRNILNYDFAFLAMLFWEAEDQPSYTCARCMVSPLKKKTVCAPAGALNVCAGYTVILAYWKLRDSVTDESFFISLRDRIISVLLRRAYKKASAEYPAFTAAVRSNLEALKQLEASGNDVSEQSKSLDEYADRFARITEALVSITPADPRYRPLRQLMYHTGRFIYILDAFDDLSGDLKKNRFNPLVRRFKLSDGKLDDADLELLRSTVLQSCGLIGASYELLPPGAWSPVLQNIIYLGMPNVCHKVLDGTWRASGRRRNTEGMSSL